MFNWRIPVNSQSQFSLQVYSDYALVEDTRDYRCTSSTLTIRCVNFHPVFTVQRQVLDPWQSRDLQ